MADLHDEETINRLFPDTYPDGTYLVVEAEGNVFFTWKDSKTVGYYTRQTGRAFRRPADAGDWFTDDEHARSLSHLLRMADRVWVLGAPTVVLPGANPPCEFTPTHEGAHR